MKVKKILIFTANYGDGHIKTANSLSKKISESNPSIEVKVVNLYNEAHPIVNKMIKNIYLKCYSTVPQLYGFLYYFIKHPSHNLYLNNIVGLFGRNKLKSYLKDFNPDLVINTFPILAMPMLYKKGMTKVPCYTVVTDYGIHSQWIDPGIKKYFVGHESVKEEMVEWGIEQQKIEALGIPVSIECDDNIDKISAFDKYGFENKELPLITILAGANGVMRNIDKMCSTLYEIRPKAQYAIVCGKNKSLKAKLEKITKGYSDRMKVFGFVENLHELMKISDIVITKPGGLTTTEVLNLGVPFIMFGNPAGQENENKNFFLKYGCSFYKRNADEIASTVSQLIKEPEKLSGIKSNLKTVAKPSGCDDIVNSIISDFENMGSAEQINNDNKKIIQTRIIEVEY